MEKISTEDTGNMRKKELRCRRVRSDSCVSEIPDLLVRWPSGGCEVVTVQVSGRIVV